MKRLLPLFLLLVSAPELHAAEDPLASFVLHPDFEIELVAIEPNVIDPVDIEWDEHGRMYVCEMPGYPFPKVPGRIVILEDEDGDGVYEKRTVYAEGFKVADSILPYNGGFLVASPPELVFVKDTDGDDVADVYETMMEGFSLGNTQHNYNGLTWGLDNWVYAANGGNSGSPYFVGDEENRVPIQWQDFRFDPRNRKLETTGVSTGGFGIALDDWDNYFGTHNLVHIQHMVFPSRYLEGIDELDKNTLVNISDHEENGTARVYAIGEQETRVNHPEQSGYFSGACGIACYNGGAFPEEYHGNIFVCDVVLNAIHRDVLTPKGTTFTASRGREGVEFLASSDRSFRPVNICIGPDGAMYVADMHREVIEHPEWIPDEIEENMDLEAGKDQGRIYRIVPKGGLPKVDVDFSRDDLEGAVEALGHPNRWWRSTAQRLLVEWEEQKTIQQVLKVMNAGDARAKAHGLWTLNALGDLNSQDIKSCLLVGEHGLTSQALYISELFLKENEKDEELLQPLIKTISTLPTDQDARANLQRALLYSTMFQIDELTATDEPLWFLVAPLAHRFQSDTSLEKAVLAALYRAPVDESNVPLYHAATWGYVLPEFVDEGSGPASSGFSKKAAEMLWNRGGVAEAARLLETYLDFEGRRQAWYEEHPNRGPSILDEIVQGQAITKGIPSYGDVLTPTSYYIDGLAAGANAKYLAEDPEGAAAFEEQLAKLAATEPGSDLWRAALNLGRKLGRELDAGQREVLLARGVARAADADAETEARLNALELAAYLPFEDRRETLFALLDTRGPAEVQRAAMEQIADDGGLPEAERLVGMWRDLGTGVRRRAADFLLYKRGHHPLLLSALEDGRVPIGQLNLDLERRRHLLRSRDKDTRTRAAALFTDAGVVTRGAAIEKMRPALELAGDPVRGAAFFAETCAQCHRKGAIGHDVGPNLTEIYRKSKETLIHDILDPNAGVEPQYLSYTIELADADLDEDDLVSGMVVEESASQVTLRQANAIDVAVPRDRIKSMTTSGLSLMPEELEAGLDPQAFADLLAYLQQVE